MNELKFSKMHGLGNDFVVFDGRVRDPELSPGAVRAIANRHTGVGCDQLIVLEPTSNGAAEVFMRIYNADGGESAACGNATRCIGVMLMGETGREQMVIETAAGLLEVVAASHQRVSVDMGPVHTDWHEIPLAHECNTLNLPVEADGMASPVGVNVGNPHMVFFVDDVSVAPIDELGHQLELHPLFPERANVQMAEVLGYDRIRLKTWERGVGRTIASGSSACATLAAAHRRGLTGRTAEIIMDGGALGVTWRDDNHIVQTGPAAVSFSGTIDPSLLAGGDES
ncbi:MAG: diaminopimelate epimerase [Alphaproteobacteria bacterium]|nr:diaminopimelate epimerase [Alphaproteobacteria bacterium]